MPVTQLKLLRLGSGRKNGSSPIPSIHSSRMSRRLTTPDDNGDVVGLAHHVGRNFGDHLVLP